MKFCRMCATVLSVHTWLLQWIIGIVVTYLATVAAIAAKGWTR